MNLPALREFIPNSRLKLHRAQFDEINQNEILIAGFFEENGIEETTELLEAEAKIYIYFKEQCRLEPWVNYRCNKILKNDLGFTIVLKPISESFNQSLLLYYSKTCRADFGDAKCKADKTRYEQIFNIITIEDNFVTLAAENIEDGYYAGGTAKIENDTSIIPIRANKGNILELTAPIRLVHSTGRLIVVPGCDKRLITCCNKYNNAVNFRGEPFIPTTNYFNNNE